MFGSRTFFLFCFSWEIQKKELTLEDDKKRELCIFITCKENQRFLFWMTFVLIFVNVKGVKTKKYINYFSDLNNHDIFMSQYFRQRILYMNCFQIQQIVHIPWNFICNFK